MSKPIHKHGLKPIPGFCILCKKNPVTKIDELKQWSNCCTKCAKKIESEFEERYYKEARNLGARHVADIIVQHHKNPANKIKGLVRLLWDGHEVRIAQFSIDQLVVDGKLADWSILEKPTI